MKLRYPALLFLATLCLTATHAADNQLTAAEKSAGWQLLFDGKTLNGWRGYKLNGLPPNLAWEVKDGVLHAMPKKYDVNSIPPELMAEFRRSELITENKFDNFELAWEWRIAKVGNNGLKYFVTEDRPNSPGPEYQMVDDANHPAAKAGPINQSGSFFMVLPTTDAKPNPVGEWNTSRITVRGSSVEHWLNGKKVLAFEIGSEAVKAGIARSKFKAEPRFAEKYPGHIMLTYHGDECWVKNMKVRELK